MKPFAIALFVMITQQTASYAQLGEGTFIGQCDAGSLATGGQMINYSMVDSANIELGIQRSYFLKALDRISVDAVLPLHTLCFRAGYTQVGDDIMLEQSFLAFLGKTISKGAHVNVGCGYYLLHAINGNSGQCVYADIQVLYQPTSAWVAGCRLINPTGTTVKLEGVKKRMEQHCIIGLTVYPSRTVAFVLEGEKQAYQLPITRLGLRYSLDQAFIVMGGFSSNPMQPAWGIGGQTDRFRYAVGFRSHPQLGLSTALTCSYVFRRKP